MLCAIIFGNKNYLESHLDGKLNFSISIVLKYSMKFIEIPHEKFENGLCMVGGRPHGVNIDTLIIMMKT